MQSQAQSGWDSIPAVKLIEGRLDERGRPILRLIAFPPAAVGQLDLRRRVFGSFLIDTGATATTVDSAWVGKLSLSPVGTRPLNLPFAQMMGLTANVFELDLFIPNKQRGDGKTVGDGFYLDRMRLCSNGNFAAIELDGVVGRDVLDRCTLTYYGKERRFSLNY